MARVVNRLISGIVMGVAVFALSAILTGGTKVEIDLDSGRTRVFKEVLALPLYGTVEIVDSDFSRTRIQNSAIGLTGVPKWRTGQFFKWYRNNYSAQYEYSWVLRMARQLSQDFPLLQEAARQPFKVEFLSAVARGDSDAAGVILSRVRLSIVSTNR
jgi:hypothetical protein